MAFLELKKISVKIHGCTRAGGDDDRKVASENRSRVTGDLAGGDPIAGIKGGLPAAGLIFGKLDGDAKMFEDFDSGAGDVVIECIAKAGSHEEHAFVGGALELGGHGELIGFMPIRHAEKLVERR